MALNQPGEHISKLDALATGAVTRQGEKFRRNVPFEGKIDAQIVMKAITALDLDTSLVWNEGDGVVVFHAGTSLNSKGEFVTNGGRVLAVTAVADNLAAAHRNAYEAVARISWEGLEHRKDIGKKELDSTGKKPL